MVPVLRGAVRMLWCLVEGKSTLFQVDTPSSDNINQLKNLVHKGKDKGILRDVNATDLVVWKVRIDKPA
jgi:hypothetical protein